MWVSKKRWLELQRRLEALESRSVLRIYTRLMPYAHEAPVNEVVQRMLYLLSMDLRWNYGEPARFELAKGEPPRGVQSQAPTPEGSSS